MSLEIKSVVEGVYDQEKVSYNDLPSLVLEFGKNLLFRSPWKEIKTNERVIVALMHDLYLWLLSGKRY